MAEHKISGKQFKRLEYLVGHVESEVDVIQSAGIEELCIDWYSLWAALTEIRENIGLPKLE